MSQSHPSHLQSAYSLNWDGHGAAPVSKEALHRTVRFLMALPLGSLAPSVGAEPDGYLTLEWHRSPRRVLSVSIGPDDDVHYAALIGASKANGTEPFHGDVSRSIVQLIHRVMGT